MRKHIKELFQSIFLTLCISSIVFQNEPVSLDHPILLGIEDNQPSYTEDGPYARFLENSCRLQSKWMVGSGTIVGYSPDTNTATILSCGHLFDATRGSMSKDMLSRIDIRCLIEIFYRGREKLSTPGKYDGRLIYCQSGKYIDISLIEFHPDWIPTPTRIASGNPTIPKTLHSVGCDRKIDPKHYFVRFYGDLREEYRTRFNSPRPGRSGGGLFLDSGELIGICCRTTNEMGTGFGYFMPLRMIRETLESQGFTSILR